MNLLFFQTLKNGTVSRNLTHYSTYDSALSFLYGGMRASVNDLNIVKVVAILMDDNGATYKFESWEREPAPEPEPEPEDEPEE